MLIGYFIVIALTLNVSYAGEDHNYDVLQNNFDCITNEGNPCEFKLSAALSILKTELLHNYRKLDMLQKQNYELEERIYGKFHKLENNILDKLEQYMEGRLDSLEKHLSRKIDALEKNIPDKTDIIILNHKIEALNKMQADFDGSIRESKIIANETLKRVHEETVKNISELENRNSENTATYFKLDALDTKFTNLENNLNRTLIPDIESIKTKLDMVDKKNRQYIEENINPKLDSIEKHILNITNYKSCNWDTLNNTLGQILNDNNGFENRKKKTVLPNRTYGYWDCKRRSISGYDYSPIRMDDETLNFVTLESDLNGLARFEMDFAVKGRTYSFIQLSPVPHPGIEDGYFAINLYEGPIVEIYKATATTDDINKATINIIKSYDTQKLLFPDTYTAIHIKIHNGTLELGKPGQTPSVTYSDGRLRTMSYIGFTSWDSGTATFMYDCPPHFEETIF